MYTQDEVYQQRDRFNAFIQSANLEKIGEKWMWFMAHDAGDGRFNNHVYIHRVLSLCANVKAAMYHPEKLNDGLNSFYCEILTQAALKAYLDLKWDEIKAV